MLRIVMFCAAISACLALAGCQVHSPGSFETKLIEGAKRRITVGGRSDVNPLAATTENVRAGQRTFVSYCMVCHGLDGQNTGVPFAEKNGAAGSSVEFAVGASLYRRATTSDDRERHFAFGNAGVARDLS